MASRDRVSPVGVRLAVALLSLSACATENVGPPPAAAAASTRAPEVALLWTNAELHPIAQPKAVGGVAVGIVHVAERKLMLVGIDPATGHELWRHPITPSRITRGVAVDFVTVGEDKVAYLQPTSVINGAAELSVADARSGAVVASTQALQFRSPIARCGGGDVCAIASEVYGSGAQRPLRLEVATGKTTVATTELGPRARMLSAELLDLGDRPGNTLALLRDGEVKWRTPVSSAFPRGFTSDHGWAWHLFEREHVFVGSVGGEWTVVGPTMTFDLATASATAGISEATGQVLWRDRGSNFNCRMVHETYAVRCRARGVGTIQVGGPTSFQGLHVTVEGFDVTTGKTTWSLPLGDSDELSRNRQRPAIAGATEVLVAGPAGPLVLDHATGQTVAASPGATFWCRVGTKYEFSMPLRRKDGALIFTRPGGKLAAVCDERGRPATAWPSAAATTAAGARVGNRVVIATKRGYRGFEVRTSRSR